MEKKNMAFYANTNFKGLGTAQPLRFQRRILRNHIGAEFNNLRLAMHNSVNEPFTPRDFHRRPHSVSSKYGDIILAMSDPLFILR